MIDINDGAIGGVPARELCVTYGTPLMVIDTGEVELEIDRFVRAFVSRGITVSYAGKAFLVTAFAELLAATPLRLDVCSLGELITGERGGFPAARIELHTPGDACFMNGAPDLMVQMLDKLIDNAVDFCAASGSVIVTLTRAPSRYELSVENDGPPIPPDLLGRLFESLFEHRPGAGDKPHFGLGLYIVRLIAEYHGGRALAGNRSGGSGAIFTVILPLI